MDKLFLILIGCRPPGRIIEQHDIFIGIGESMKDLIPAIKNSWPESKGKLHIDAWREVTTANGYKIKVLPDGEKINSKEVKLFFINLGGYKKNEFEEFHYKMIIAAKDKGEAVKFSKETAFFRHTGFSGANSHIDDKYGIDVDDIFEITDILPDETKQKFQITVSRAEKHLPEDEIHLGYFKLETFK